MQTIEAFDRQFPTDDACKRYLVSKRWPKGVTCPRCKATERVYALKARPFHWACKNVECGGKNGYRFSVLTATIFQDTKIGLRLWFKVGYLMLTAKKGISALQIHRVIFGEDSGSDHHTSWYMCHRWRAAMKGDAFPLTGEVEIDETYIGGKETNKHRSKRKWIGGGTGGKIGVVGAIARKGNVVCKVIGSMDAPTIKQFVYDTVSPNVSLVATDQANAYKRLRYEGFPQHESVDHRQHEYVRGNVHTAHIDQFWSLLKRGVMGSFHHVSKDYLPLYLNEFSFRFNNRKNSEMFADMITTCSQ